MIMESIQIVKHGVVIREYPCQYYTTNILSGLVSIVDKETRKVAAILSPNYYDYVEIVTCDEIEETADGI